MKTHMTEQEFAYLSDRIRSKLIALARRFNRASGCGADAEDIVQDALLSLWQLSEQGYPVRDAEALAVKITKTRCVERYRRRHLRLEPMDDRPIAGGYSATSGTEEMDIETILGIVQKDLTESQRKLLALRNEDGLTLDEIAAVTGRPKTSIKVALSAARKKMMERYKKMK
jgi:RNA polymerase sigma-70 factor (ECF subfamily)